jgi:ABC-type hemin transport system ATPase subunit
VEPAITARDLVVELGGRQILHGLTFDVPTGQVAGLLGPSGCGKTALMRCLVGAPRRLGPRPAQDVPIRIAIADTHGLGLLPGMSATARIRTG